MIEIRSRPTFNS